MEDIDIKEIAKQVVEETLRELKDSAVEIATTQIVPAAKEAKEKFIVELKQEASSSDSLWVKVRNLLIMVAVNVGAKIGDKFIQNIARIR